MLIFLHMFFVNNKLLCLFEDVSVLSFMQPNPHDWFVLSLHADYLFKMAGDTHSMNRQTIRT